MYFRSLAACVLSLAAVLLLGACQPSDQAWPSDGGIEGGVALGSTKQALETSLCGPMTGVQAGAAWPMRGGCPTRSAQSSEFGPVTGSKNWEVNLGGKVTSSPVIAADGSIFIGSEANKLVKINPATGAILKSANMLAPVRSSPAIGKDGFLYIGTDLFRTYRVDMSTLALKWNYQALGRFVASPTILADGTIVIGSEDFAIYGLNPSTGAKKWSYMTSLRVTSSPAVDPTSTAIYVGSEDLNLYALNTNGTLKWKKGLGAPVYSTPAVGRDGRIFVSAGTTVYAIDPADGATRWQQSIPLSLPSSPAIGANGSIYVGLTFSVSKGSLYAFSADGSEQWHADYGSGVESTPIIDRAGNIYFGTKGGEVIGLDSTGRELWRFQAGGEIIGSPALAKGGAVIIGSTNGKLFSIGTGAVRAPAGGVCGVDANCEPGLICGEEAGPRFGKAAGTGVCWLPSCENKVQDPGETELDCGGPCGSCTKICSQSCTLGTQVTPPAQEVLRFTAGIFTRGGPSTYQLSANKLAAAGGHQLRYEDRGDGNGRVALFEGARTNRIVWSQALGHQPEWWTGAATTPTMTLTEDASVSPDGALSADRWVAAAGANGARAQTIVNAMPAGSLSAWLRLTNAASFNPANPLKTRAVLTDLTGGWYNEPFDWSLPAAWERRSLATKPATQSTAVQLSHKGAWPGSATQCPVLDAADYALWGWQLEEGTFPSSYIATSASAATRRADQLVFESKDVPSWLKAGIWQFDVLPIFASAEIATTDEFVLVAWEGGQISLGKDATGGALKITSGTTSVRQTIEWARNTKLTVTVNTGAASISVRGASKGDGTFSYGTMAVGGTGRVGVGAMLDGTKVAFSRISELRKVGSATVACVPDPDCSVCGDKLVTGTEVCDTALDSHCSKYCTRTGEPVTPCEEDSECGNGQVCGSFNSSIFGLSTFSNVCWPAFCETNPASGCGTELSPCGICLCMPDCTNQACGSTADDGCGGECTGLCAIGEACTENSDCGFGQLCGTHNGAGFGQAASLDVCWDARCEIGGGPGANCGAVSCFPQCEDRSCGDDGCGGSCGSCDGTCMEGQCLAAFKFYPADALSPLPMPLAPVPPEDIDQVGTLPGAMSVGATGTAEYTIPIDVPPGPGGMQPHLSLSYSSGRGNGLLGMGWSIVGPELSVIARCPRTALDAGGANPVVYDVGEKFCLDGSPLVLLTGPPPAPSDGGGFVHGATVVRQYRTQLDTFARINALTWPGGSYPSFWVVTTKDGRTLSYGSTSKSQLPFQSADESHVAIAMSWAVDKVLDRAGNEMRIRYRRLQSKAGQALLSDLVPVSFAYGKLRTVDGVVSSDRKVNFRYEERPDDITGYRGGQLLRRMLRLKEVQAVAVDSRDDQTHAENRTRSYWFTYGHIPNGQGSDALDGVGRPITETSRLTQVQVCAADQAVGCLPPTKLSYVIDRELGYRQGGFPKLVTAEPVPPPSAPPRGLLFDMNGDGKADRVWAQPKEWHIGEPPPSTLPWGANRQFALDIGETPGSALHPQNGPAESLIAPWPGQSSFASGEGPTREEVLALVGEQDPALVADFDHDGRDDLVYPSWFTMEMVLLHSVGRSFVYASFPTARTPFKPKDWLVLDVDGDGYQDLFRCGAGLGFMRNTGNGFEPERVLSNVGVLNSLSGTLSCPKQGGERRPLTFDTDGDGIANILLNWTSQPGIRSRLVAVRFTRAGNGWNTIAVATGLAARMKNDPQKTLKTTDVRPVVIDLNGDGLSDMLVPRVLSEAAKTASFWANHCNQFNSQDGIDSLTGCIGLEAWINTGSPRTVFKNYGFLMSREQAQTDPEVNPGTPGEQRFVAVPPKMLLSIEGAAGLDYDGDGRQDLILPSAPVWRRFGEGQLQGPPIVVEYAWRVFRGFNELGDIRDAAPAEFAHTGDLIVGTGSTRLDGRLPTDARVEFADFDGNGVGDVHVWAPAQSLHYEYGDVPGQGRQLLWQRPARNALHLYGLGTSPDRMNLERVTSGLGAIETFEYAYGTGPHYTPELDATCIYGTRCFQHLSSPVVVRHSVETPEHTIVRRFERIYKGLRADPVRRSSVGFAEVAVREVNPSDWTISLTTTQYDQRAVETSFGAMHPFASRPTMTSRSVFVKDGDLSKYPEYVSTDKVEYHWELGTSDAGLPFVALQTLGEYSIALAGADSVLKRGVSYLTDAYGNTTDTTTVWADGAITVAHVEFDLTAARLARWQTELPRFTRHTFLRSLGATASYRRSSFEFDDRGLLAAVVREPFVFGDPAQAGFAGFWALQGKRTEFARDPAQHFNVTDIRESGFRAEEDRTTHLDWTSDSVAPDFVRDDLGHTTYMAVDRGTGAMLSHRSEDGARTRWRRDGFGRPYEVETPLGVASVRRTAEPSSGPHVAVGYTVKESDPDGSMRETLYNSVGLPLRVWTDGLQGLPLKQELEYDFRGLLVAQSRPSSGLAPDQGIVRFERDDSGRVLATHYPDGTSTTYLRARAAHLRPELGFVAPKVGETVEGTIDARGQMTLRRQGARGLTHAIFESAGLVGLEGEKWLTTRYHYGNFDGLRRIEDPEKQVTEFGLDVYNRVTQRIDPASGTTAFNYGGFDDLLATDDAKGQHVAYEYDSLGRLTSRTGPDGSASWAWDCFGAVTGCKAESVGKLVHTQRAGVTTDYTYYPSTGLDASMKLAIEGEGSFATSVEYLPNGNLKSLRMDAWNSNGGAPQATYAVQYGYDSADGGEVTSIRRVGVSTDLWTLDNTYGGLAPAKEHFGNGAYRHTTYEDKTGRVQRLLDSSDPQGRTVLSDRFYTYDGNGNVKTVGAAPTIQSSLRTIYEYDLLDRLTSVSGLSPAESLTYDDAGNITSKQGMGAYSYEDAKRPCDPLSATSCTGAYDTYRPHAVRSAGTTKFEYDNNGNEKLRTTPSGTLKTDYTDFNLPKLMTPNGSAAAAVSFGYNADGERVIKRAPGRTTIFMGDLYQRTVESTGTKHEFFLPLGSGAQLHVTRDAKGSEQTEYLLQDHLGSSRMALSSAKKVLTTRGFDSFGQATGTAVGTDQPGFTGHRHDTDLGLIHMKGRTYDPKLGRFLQPDPIMGSPVGTGLNRYAYVFNNPMRYVDPTGLLGEPITLPTIYITGNVDRAVDSAERSIMQAEMRMDGLSANQPGAGPTTGVGLVGGGPLLSSQGEPATIRQGEPLCYFCSYEDRATGGSRISPWFDSTATGADWFHYVSHESLNVFQVASVLVSGSLQAGAVSLGEKVFTTTAGRSGAIAENVIKEGTRLTLENFTIASVKNGRDLVGPARQLLDFAKAQGAATLRFTGTFTNKQLAGRFGAAAGDAFEITVNATRQGLLDTLRLLQ